MTPSQKQIIMLLAQGKIPKQIASELKVSCGTVRKHIDNIRERYNEFPAVRNRLRSLAGLVGWAIEEGWIEFPVQGQAGRRQRIEQHVHDHFPNLTPSVCELLIADLIEKES